MKLEKLYGIFFVTGMLVVVGLNYFAPRKIESSDGISHPSIESMVSEGISLAKQKQFDAAREVFKNALKRLENEGKADMQNVTHEELIFNVALTYFEQGNISQSKDMLMKAITQDNFSHVKSVLLVSRCFEKSGDTVGALAWVESRMQQFPESPEIYNEAGVLAYKLQNKDKSKLYFEKAGLLKPSNSFSMQGMSILARDDQKPLKNSLYYRSLYAKEKNLAHGSNLALSLIKEKKYEEALAINSEVLKEFPDDIFCLKLQARLYGHKRKWKQALESLLKARKLSPVYDIEMEMILGVTYFNQYNLDAAYEVIKQAHEKDVNNRSVLDLLVKICEGMPQRQEEYRSYRKILDNQSGRVDSENRP